MASEDLLSAVSFQKLPGTLKLDGNNLSWAPSSSSSSSSSSFALPLKAVSGLSVSKAGSENVALQVAFDEDGVKATGISKAKILLTFTGGVEGNKPRAELEREEFKKRLMEILSQNRDRKAASSGSQTPQAAPVSPQAPRSPAVTTASTPAAVSASRNTAASAKEEHQLRVSLLKADPNLTALHRQTVMSRLITDAEFWSHPARQALIRSARQAAAQQKGKNARIIDPRFQVGKDGQMKMEITDEDRKDMLEQNEVLRLAHLENVPGKLDEASFWQRYFTSKLYHKARNASVTNVRPDAIFDSYIPLWEARYPDSREPAAAAMQREARNRLIDLGATDGDHEQSGNEKDRAMKAGSDRDALSMARRFNEHSERVLASSLGQADVEHLQTPEGEAADQIGRKDRRKKARTEGERGVELDYQSAHAQRYEEEIVIDDLEERRERMAVPLNLNPSAQAPGRRGAPGAGKDRPKTALPRSRLPPKQALSAMIASMGRMPSNGAISADFLLQSGKKMSSSQSTATTLESELTELILVRRGKNWSDLSDLSDPIRKKTLEIHGSATEVMRQFWNAVSPPDDDKRIKAEEGESRPEPPTPAERQAKAKRMMDILKGMDGQIEEVLQQTGGGTEEDRVASALNMTRQACQRAVVVGEMIYGS